MERWQSLPVNTLAEIEMVCASKIHHNSNSTNGRINEPKKNEFQQLIPSRYAYGNGDEDEDVDVDGCLQSE